jgi:hypothetical protein
MGGDAGPPNPGRVHDQADAARDKTDPPGIRWAGVPAHSICKLLGSPSPSVLPQRCNRWGLLSRNSVSSVLVTKSCVAGVSPLSVGRQYKVRARHFGTLLIVFFGSQDTLIEAAACRQLQRGHSACYRAAVGRLVCRRAFSFASVMLQSVALEFKVSNLLSCFQKCFLIRLLWVGWLLRGRLKPGLSSGSLEWV